MSFLANLTNKSAAVPAVESSAFVTQPIASVHPHEITTLEITPTGTVSSSGDLTFCFSGQPNKLIGDIYLAYTTTIAAASSFYPAENIGAVPFSGVTFIGSGGYEYSALALDMVYPTMEKRRYDEALAYRITGTTNGTTYSGNIMLFSPWSNTVKNWTPLTAGARITVNVKQDYMTFIHNDGYTTPTGSSYASSVTLIVEYMEMPPDAHARELETFQNGGYATMWPTVIIGERKSYAAASGATAPISSKFNIGNRSVYKAIYGLLYTGETSDTTSDIYRVPLDSRISSLNVQIDSQSIFESSTNHLAKLARMNRYLLNENLAATESNKCLNIIEETETVKQAPNIILPFSKTLNDANVEFTLTLLNTANVVESYLPVLIVMEAARVEEAGGNALITREK